MSLTNSIKDAKNFYQVLNVIFLRNNRKLTKEILQNKVDIF